MPNKKLKIQHFLKAFTLIELLIVISIIGILASLTLASFGSAQAKARDGVRKSDLAQMKRALELYKADCDSGSWYPFLASPDTDIKGQPAPSTLGAILLQNGATPPVPYMNPVPKDPTDTGTQKYVYTSGTGSGATSLVCPSAAGVSNAIQGTQNYAFSVQLERVNDSDGQKTYTACSGKPGVPASYTQGYYYVCNN